MCNEVNLLRDRAEQAEQRSSDLTAALQHIVTSVGGYSVRTVALRQIREIARAALAAAQEEAGAGEPKQCGLETDHPFDEWCPAGCAPGTHTICRKEGCFYSAEYHPTAITAPASAPPAPRPEGEQGADG